MVSCKALARLWLVTIVTLGFAAPALAVTADEFLLRSGADIVALCATPPSDPLYTAAVHMCHGFGAGTYQTLAAMTRHEKLQPIICPPAPPPTRNETVRRFIEWAGRNPQHSSEPAVEALARFLITEFPCPAK
jgi:Rap1a immunity proteins